MANVVGRGWHIQCRQACVLCGRIVADIVLIIAWALPGQTLTAQSMG